MQTIDSIPALEALYDDAAPASLTKVTPVITPNYRKWIEASRFCILSTVGPEGTDATPRGDDGPVVRIADEKTILMPDWRGNNRLDNLRNIVRDPRVSLMFLIPGEKNVVRVNGTAKLTADADLCHSFEQKGMHPKPSSSSRSKNSTSNAPKPSCAQASGMVQMKHWSYPPQVIY